MCSKIRLFPTNWNCATLLAGKRIFCILDPRKYNDRLDPPTMRGILSPEWEDVSDTEDLKREINEIFEI